MLRGNQTSAEAKQQMVALPQTAKLDYNHPNPAAQRTVIKYFVPEKTTLAAIRIANTKGRVIKFITLSAKGNGQVNLQTNDLTAGTYFYTLIIDGKITDTKQMLVSH